ncbi:MAG: hypothetical protein RDU20_12985 [Desulfomonilaceae bacterium]|nr:hypothetical protein [Desulfomonilaceae bacterium]
MESISVRQLIRSTATAPFRDKAAFVVFCLVSLQAAFLMPHVTLMQGERANVFTGLLCAVSLLTALALVKPNSRNGTVGEAVVSLVLPALIVISGCVSVSPQSSLLRGFVVAASGLGGFWTARMVLDTPEKQLLFAWLCTIVLAMMLVFCVAGHLIFGDVKHLLDFNPHPIAGRILLLSLGPLTLILIGGRAAQVSAAALLCGVYAVFCLTGLRSAMLVPVALAALALGLRKLSPRKFLTLAVPMALVFVVSLPYLPQYKTGLEYESAYYRAESLPFSWHIVKKHPLFGIGLRAPRDQYLEDYEKWYPYVTREELAESVRTIVTSENTFLTFTTDVGIPFSLLYAFSVLVLVLKLVRSVRGEPRVQTSLPPMALLLPIVGALLHLQVVDGLLLPQYGWFFHVLLGLIPTLPNVQKE